MGSKHASIHLRCDDSAALIEKIKKEFDQKETFLEKEEKHDAMVLDMARKFMKNECAEIADEKERAAKEAKFEDGLALLSDIMQKTRKNSGKREKAAIIVGEKFVSVYWYDVIRSDNLKEEVLEYAQKYQLPVLGVAAYDDTNFQIYAVSADEATPGCFGEYWFDEDDITPVRAEDICSILRTPFWLGGFRRLLACGAGMQMQEVFEAETGMEIFASEELCEAWGLKEICQLEMAAVFSRA